MTRTLSFVLTSTTAVSEFGQRPHLAVDVRPLADGQSLYAGERSDVFDAIEMLLQEAEPCEELDIFTCTCGVAGCAGIHESCRLEVSDHDVSWAFPEDPFRQRLNQALFPMGQPLRVTFGKLHYEAALAELVAQLEQLRRESNLPVAVMPCLEPSDESLDTPLTEFLERCRARYADHEAWSDTVAQAEGALRTTVVVAELPGGVVQGCCLSSIAWELMSELERGVDKIEHLNTGFREQLLADPLSTARSLSAEQLADLFGLDANSPVEDYAPDWAAHLAAGSIRWSVRTG